jgi:tetratricopeptide (TPR) repeat protein
LIGKNIILKDTLLRLSGAGSLLNDQLKLGNTAWKENTALNKEAGERFKTTASELTVLWNRVKDVGITLGQSLLPVLRDLITLIEPVVAGAAKAAEWFGKLPEPIRLAGVAVLGFVAAIGPVTFLFGQVTAAAGLVTKALGVAGLTASVTTASGAMATTASVTIPALIAAMAPLVAAVAGVTAVVAIGTQAWKLWGETAERNKGVELEQQRRYAMIAEASKIAGKQILTYAEAVEIVTKNARQNADEQERVQKWWDAQQESATQAAPKLRRVAEASEEVTEALKKQQAALKALKEEYSGANTFAEAALHLKAIGDLTKLTKEEQERALGVLQGALDKYNALGQKAPQALLMTTIQLDAMNQRLKDSKNFVEALGLQLDKSLNQPALVNTFDPTKFLEPFKKAVPSALATGVSLGQSMMTGMSNAFQQLGPTILSAVTGGGNVLQSVGSLFGLELGKSFVTDFGKHIKGALGATLGGALNALIPGLGALLGPLLGKIGGFFKNLFGIDPAIKAARNSLESFQAQLRQGLTDAQRLEAGNEQWKMDIIAVRDAFLKVGRSEEEALKLVEALWDTDNPERSRRAMEEIQRVLEQIARETQNATDEANALGDALDNATRDRTINIDVNAPPGEWTGDMPDDVSRPSSDTSPFSASSFAPVSASALSGLSATTASAPTSLARASNTVSNSSVVNNTLLPVLVVDRTEVDKLTQHTERHLAERGIKGNEFGLREVIENIVEQVVSRRIGTASA